MDERIELQEAANQLAEAKCEAYKSSTHVLREMYSRYDEEYADWTIQDDLTRDKYVRQVFELGEDMGLTERQIAMTVLHPTWVLKLCDHE